MNKLIEKICEAIGLYLGEYIKDYRENTNKIFESISQKESQINSIILAGSIAGLTAVAALNKEVFASSGFIAISAFVTIGLFLIVILLSLINLYLSTLALADIQKKIVENFKTFRSPKKDIENYRFKKTQSILNFIILVGFCLGLISLLILLGLYVF